MEELSEVTSRWIASRFNWKVYGTLTFREPREPDVADRYWRRLVQVLNREAFGKQYVRRVGHSYFSYVLAMEYQKREVVHFHFLSDKPICFDLLHAYWNSAAGFAWMEKVESVEAVSIYVTKYLLKAACRLQLFECKNPRTPLITGPEGTFLPYWWPLEPGVSIVQGRG